MTPTKGSESVDSAPKTYQVSNRQVLAYMGGLALCYLATSNNLVVRGLFALFLCCHLLCLVGIIRWWFVFIDSDAHAIGANQIRWSTMKVVSIIGCAIAGFAALAGVMAFGIIQMGNMSTALMLAISATIAGFEVALYWSVRTTNRYVALMERGDYADALEVLQPMLARNELGDMLNAATCHAKLKNMSEANRLWDQALVQSSRDVNILNNVATAYHANGRIEEALALVNEAVEKDPQLFILFNQCLFLKDLNRIPEAYEVWLKIKDLERANGIVLEDIRVPGFQESLDKLKRSLGVSDRGPS